VKQSDVSGLISLSVSACLIDFICIELLLRCWILLHCSQWMAGQVLCSDEICFTSSTNSVDKS